MFLAVAALGAVTHFRGAAGSSGIMDDERLLFADGTWHRLQRKHVAFETSCYYTHEPALPLGCQYNASTSDAWLGDGVRKEQRDVLMNLYDSTGGDQWRTSDNWGEGDPCWDAWYGVTCDDHGHVTMLELADNRLDGMLPDTLGRLTSMLKLDLSTTQAAYHSYVNLNANHLHGSFPSLAEMTRLEEIEVSGNNFQALPQDLYLNAKTLRLLSASRNQLTSLPQFLSRFSNLHTLELGNNQINMEFPSDFGSLTSIRYVHLEYNLISGAIPEQVTGMNRILVFDVAHNENLAGMLPEEIIVQWREAEYISILNTSITGYIAQLCIDVPFCWRYMYDTHADLTWAAAYDVPDIVNKTIELALAAAASDGNGVLP